MGWKIEEIRAEVPINPRVGKDIAGGKMKKLILLLTLILLSSSILYADDTKTFNTADGGIVKIKPFWNGFDMQLIYDPVANAPNNVKQYLKIEPTHEGPWSDYGSVPGFANPLGDTFNMKFLDKDGFELCNEDFYYSKFALDETTNHPRIVLREKVEGWGLNANKIFSVLIDYK